jgi:hypothetical protein
MSRSKGWPVRFTTATTIRSGDRGDGRSTTATAAVPGSARAAGMPAPASSGQAAASRVKTIRVRSRRSAAVSDARVRTGRLGIAPVRSQRAEAVALAMATGSVSSAT